MKKVAILISEGFEEGETMAVVDVTRRANVHCDLISAEGEKVTSTNGVTVIADRLLDDSVKDYDMLIIPGGFPHINILPENEKALELIRYFDADSEKYLVAICSGPVVLAKAGLVKGRKLTSYPGEKYEKWFTEADYRSDIIVVDDKLVTCRGPVSGFALGYTLLDLLGEDGDKMRERMLYNQFRASKF